MAAPIVWSDYQESIFRWALDASAHPHAVVEATAGSGKTTVIKEACARLIAAGATAIIYLTFSRRLVEEAKAKLSDLAGVEASTLHSIGLRMIRAEWPAAEVDGRKMTTLAKDAIERHLNGRRPSMMRGDVLAAWIDTQHRGKVWGAAKDIVRVVDVARAAAISPGSADWQPATYRDRIRDALRAREISVASVSAETDAIITLAQRVHRLGVELVDPDEHPTHPLSGHVDYGDMLQAPVEYGLSLPGRLDWVVIDEAQDLSPASQAMLALIAPPVEDDEHASFPRLLAVGDRRQAIFGFAGADSASMDRLAEQYSAQRLTLPVTYRCPRSHVALCQRIAPEMLARPDAPEGEIRRVSRDMLDQVGVGDLVLCRLNAPLMPLCLRLIQRGVQARIYGRDVAAALLSTAQEAEFRFPSEQLMPAIAAICADRAARLRRDEPEIEDDDPRMVAIDDTRETLRVLLESCAQQTTRALDAQLKALFADSGAAVWLSSVHRAKGLEADTVWIERPDLLPLQRRSQAAPEDGEWCVAFVAASRAKQRLMLIVDGCERPLHALWGEPDNDDADDDGDSSPVVEVLAPERSPSQLASDRDLREALAEIETLRRELRTQHEESLGERARQIEAERDSLRAAAIETARSIEADPGADPTPSTTLTQRRQLAEIPPWPRATPAQRIRYLRVTAGWSQADLADAAGVSARTVSTAERADGEPWISLTVSNLRAIARALDITLGELLAGH